MRIMMISEHASPLQEPGGVDSGGQNVYVAQLSLELAKLGHEVDIYTRRDAEHLPDTVQLAPGVRVVHVRAGPAEHIEKERLLEFMPQFARQCMHLLSQQAYDIIHAHFFMSGLVGLRLAKSFELPLIVTFHALGKVRRMHQREADSFPPERFRIEEELAAHADRVIAECPQDKADLLRLYGADPERVPVIPCGVDLALFRPEAKLLCRQKLDLPLNRPILLQLGRMVPRKGVDNVIRTLGCLVRNTSLRPLLVVVGGDWDTPGDRPELERLRRVADEERVSASVLFTGKKPRRDLRHYYNAADLFITTPWYEPFGITPLESMACGTAVVGSAVGGIKHSVIHGQTGFLVPPKDPARLSQVLATALGNPTLLDRMGRAGLRRVKECFTWGKVASLMLEAYGQAITGRTAIQPWILSGAQPRELITRRSQT